MHGVMRGSEGSLSDEEDEKMKRRSANTAHTHFTCQCIIMYVGFVCV